ncbi:putative cytochrome b5-like heme/steroid binding domain-containing protein [Lupinus albus]|uniref:Putative cytochrome b5-like heme/steroid binding domain-containing protein n=1 Tax=Lupinus albus TaxID=3870 RepID=A0A6A4NT44_LUPAL|nr:putative cytochrome b5-like heme/steroid binding domain-containing protein [Lupinus albus]
MALELWEMLKEAIVAYTGLSAPTFFTLLAVLIAFYYVVSSFFGSSDQHNHASSRDYEPPVQPLKPPVQLGEISEEELKAYDGSDSEKPLLMAIKGQIYDVSQSRYRDVLWTWWTLCSICRQGCYRALAKMSFEDKDLTGDISGLGPFELDALQDWEYKFMSKYVKVGTVKKTVPVTEGEAQSSAEPSESTPRDAEADASKKPTEEDGPSETPAVKSETPSNVADKA